MTPLIILNSRGQIVYSSVPLNKITRKDIIDLSFHEKTKGIIIQNGKRYFAKPITVKGEPYRFFMDFDFLVSLFGDNALRVANDIFETDKIQKEIKKEWSLTALIHMFVNSYSESLKKQDIRFEVRNLASRTTINVRPGGFILCLCLMAKLCTTETSSVKFKSMNNFGKVRIAAECEGDRTAASDELILSAMLEEVSKACGFELNDFCFGNERKISLDIAASDIGFFDLKVPLFDKYSNIFLCYASMF